MNLNIFGRKYCGIVIIDDEDYEKICHIKWHIRPDTNTFYAHGNDWNQNPKSTVQMHRIITGAKKGEIVDHINHNGLDNRKCNLRICTNLENCRNGSSERGSTSKYLGVHWRKPFDGRRGRFVASIRVNGKLINLISTQSEIEAAFAYNLAAIKHFGQFASINIISRDIKI